MNLNAPMKPKPIKKLSIGKIDHKFRLKNKVIPKHVLLVLSSFLVLILMSVSTLMLIRHQGVIIGGDEPYYLVEATSIGRFHTTNLNPGFNYAVTHHIIFPWKAQPDPNLAAQIGQGVSKPSHGLYLPGHAVGLSAVLAIPMLAGTSIAILSLVVILAALSVWLFYLVGEVSGVRSPWRFAITALVISPAYLLATTQVYPDLISGLIMAIVVMQVALVEIRGKCSTTRLTLIMFMLILFPWLDQKNILLTIILIVALLVVYIRTNSSKFQLGILVVPTIISTACLVIFNLWGFGHILGSNQTVSLFSGETLTRAIALLFDRRQGLFIQVPTVLIGLAGMWFYRHRITVAVVTTGLVVLATIYGNATQVISFGGGSFVGRFQWPVVPVLFAFTGLYLLQLYKLRRRAALIVALAIGSLYVIQAIPIVLDWHVYFNQIGWDPRTYKGWWGGVRPFTSTWLHWGD